MKRLDRSPPQCNAVQCTTKPRPNRRALQLEHSGLVTDAFQVVTNYRSRVSLSRTSMELYSQDTLAARRRHRRRAHQRRLVVAVALVGLLLALVALVVIPRGSGASYSPPVDCSCTCSVCSRSLIGAAAAICRLAGRHRRESR